MEWSFLGTGITPRNPTCSQLDLFKVHRWFRLGAAELHHGPGPPLLGRSPLRPAPKGASPHFSHWPGCGSTGVQRRLVATARRRGHFTFAVTRYERLVAAGTLQVAKRWAAAQRLQTLVSETKV